VPVLELGPQDAALAGAPSLAVHAAAVADILERGLRAEERRQSVQAVVLNVSLAVFLGLLAFLAIRKLAQVRRGLEGWLDGRPQGPPSLRVREVELATPWVVGTETLDLFAPVAQVAIGWLCVVAGLTYGRSLGRPLRLSSALLGNAAALRTASTVALAGAPLLGRGQTLQPLGR
jgi:hypothetical protein